MLYNNKSTEGERDASTLRTHHWRIPRVDLFGFQPAREADTHIALMLTAPHAAPRAAPRAASLLLRPEYRETLGAGGRCGSIILKGDRHSSFRGMANRCLQSRWKRPPFCLRYSNQYAVQGDLSAHPCRIC